MPAGKSCKNSGQNQKHCHLHIHTITCILRGHSLERGIELYQTGINKFLGNSLIKRLEKTEFTTNEELRERLIPDQSQGKGEWVDVAGLITPKSEVNKLLDNIESGNIASVEALAKSFVEMHNFYYDWEWTLGCDKD